LNHYAAPEFWTSYAALPIPVQRLAEKSFDLLKSDPRHPSFRLKKVGRQRGSASIIAPLLSKRPMDSSGFGSARTPNTINSSAETRAAKSN
jgi:hypothetical protein